MAFGTAARTRVTRTFEGVRTTLTLVARGERLAGGPAARVVAVMMTFPGFRAFTTPLGLTVATFGFDEVHTTSPA